MPPSTRERIVSASSELFRRQGYTGTGLKQIAATAEAPFGSIYHFFPGGKEQLGEEVIRTSGAMYFAMFETFMRSAPDAVSGVRSFFDGAVQLLPATDYADACPIATVALEVASTNEPLRIATADVFNSWITGAAEWLSAAGITPERARVLAMSIIALLEGAFILSRASRTTDALVAARDAAVELLESSISQN